MVGGGNLALGGAQHLQRHGIRRRQHHDRKPRRAAEQHAGGRRERHSVQRDAADRGDRRPRGSGWLAIGGVDLSIGNNGQNTEFDG